MTAKSYMDHAQEVHSHITKKCGNPACGEKIESQYNTCKKPECQLNYDFVKKCGLDPSNRIHMEVLERNQLTIKLMQKKQEINQMEIDKLMSQKREV